MDKSGDFNKMGGNGESEIREPEDERRKRAADEFETERRNRVARWVTALDRVPDSEQQIIVVQATEGSEASVANSHPEDCSDVTIVDDMPTPRRDQAPLAPEDDSKDSWDEPDDRKDEAENDSDGEASIGASEPDLTSTALTKKKDVRDLLDHLRNTLLQKRNQEREDGELADLDAQFTRFDLNNDASISRNEFIKICKALGTDLNSEELAQVFFTIDHNGDGELAKDEFIAAFKPRPPPKFYQKKLDPMEAIQKAKPGDRPISAKLINWKSDFG